MMKFKINKTIEQISHIATNMKTLYSTQGDYSGFNHPSLAIEMKVVPDEIVDGTSLTNAFEGSIWMGLINYDKFYIGYNSLPKEACISLLSTNWGNPSSSGLYAIAIS